MRDRSGWPVAALVLGVWLSTPLALFGQGASKPTVAVVIKEGETNSRWAESALNSILMQRGFRVVSLAQREWLAWRDRAFAEAAQGRRAALAEQWKFRAQVIVFGEAQLSSSEPDTSGLAGRSAHLVLEAYRTDTGELMATHSAQANVAHVDPVAGGNQAVKRCVEKIGPLLATELSQVSVAPPVAGTSASPAAPETAPRTAYVRILGVSSHAEARQLAKLFSRITGVRSVKEAAFTLNVAEYELQSGWDSKELAARLAGIRMASASLRVLEVTPQTVRLRVSPR